MGNVRDHAGRPIVVVTGMGIVTSLGASKADNWAKLTAGQSGIRTITRFPTDGLKTTMAGSVDFLPVGQNTATELSDRFADVAAEEAVAQSGIGTRGNFPGPLFLAVAPVEMDWTLRDEIAFKIGKDAQVDYDAMLKLCGGGTYKDCLLYTSDAADE